MASLTAIIVDDEFHGRENLRSLIESYCNEVEVLASAGSAAEAKKLVPQLNPDVVFLDINMPVLDGFDFLEIFENRNFMVVLVTAHSDFGIKAVKHRVDDYLLKPINVKELQLTINKLVQFKKERPFSSPNKIILPVPNGFEIFDCEDIIRFEADGCYTKVFFKEGKTLIISKTLKEFEDITPKNIFFRVHKSHLINFNYIKEFSRLEGNHLILKDGSEIEISRRRVADFLNAARKNLKQI